MVVNRKQPFAPVPLVQSRSTSQQPIIAHKKHSKYTTSNGNDPRKPPSTNSDSKAKSTSRPRPRKKSLRGKLLGKLFVWSLSLFTLYSFLFCSSYATTPQKSQSRLICRAETGYKTYVLDPFVLPPLKHALSFSHSLAKPYISHANTHLEPYLAPVKQVTSTINSYVIQTATAPKRVWEATLIPFYKNTLKPYYQLAILPRYKLYLRPYLLPLINHLERYYAHYVSNPIRIQVNRIQLHFSGLYTTHIHSHIAHLQSYIRRFTSAVHTTYLSSGYLYGTYIRPTLQSTWTRAQPHLSFAFDQAKDISLNAAAGTAQRLKGLAKQLATQKRNYVDPHIRKIWHKIEESATARTMATPAPADISLEEEIAESTITASLITDEVISHTNTKEPINVSVPEEDAQDVYYNVESTPPPLASAPPLSTTQEAQSAQAASTVLSELEREVETLDGNVAEATISATFENSEQSPKVVLTESVGTSVGGASPSPSANTSGGVIGVGASSPTPSDSTAEDDLDDFLRDIGWDASSSSSSPSPTPTQLSEVDEAAASASAQEAEASRLASIASKRLAITTRHAALETDLQSSILASTSQIIQNLNEMREAKKEELISMIEGTSEGEAGFVAELTLSGDKLMKGLEIYMKKCQERSGAWKQSGVVGSDNKREDDEDIQKRTRIAEDEQARLESVIEKLETKFSDEVQKLQEQVHEWYLGMILKEQEEISQVTIKIKNMAEQAQASLGMNYAWLEDVTYMDWQRYHDLVRASDKFKQTANEIQNGTSVDPPSPSNPVKRIIAELQEELQTVILGFHVALGRVRNRIPELFSIYESVPVPERGETDKVRIQPIDPDLGGENGNGQNEGFDASQVIIGKSKEQIEQALGDVPLVVQHHEL